MQRAVISIGVKKTGQLPELQAALDGATAFATWARELQKIPARRVKLITDAKGPVSRDRIFETVEKITQLGFIEQLIVYFSGHGINSGLFEQWLLSRAPDDPAAAVNVKGSEFGARFCGIGHVVFISDACRTAADSIQAQRVTGGDIFPNAKPSGPEKPVDQFYATLVGNPAYEVKTVEESTSRYRAGYSTVLMEALRGDVSALVEPSAGAGYIRPRPLKHHLATAVPGFFSKLALAVSSQPDARIESDPDAWIAELPLPAAATPTPATSGSKRRARRAGRRVPTPMTGEEALPPLAVEGSAGSAPNLQRDVSMELRAALNPSAPRAPKRGVTPQARRSARLNDSTLRQYDVLVSNGETPFGPDHMETQCGVKVRGMRIERAFAPHAEAAVGTQADVVRINLQGNRRGTNVFVQLADGSAVVVPAFREFITGLSFDQSGNLEDVWCEPSANTARWQAYQSMAGEIRTLRAVIAASTALGAFRLEESDGDALLQRMRDIKSLDPALAVYAAHAFHDRRMRGQIVDMQRHLDATLGVRIFDVAMLAFSLKERSHAQPMEMYPCVPMLTQGWALLSPLDITLPARLGELRGMLRSSLWTHFAAAATGRLFDALSKGKVE